MLRQVQTSMKRLKPRVAMTSKASQNVTPRHNDVKGYTLLFLIIYDLPLIKSGTFSIEF